MSDQQNQELTDEEAILQLAKAMKGTSSSQEEKHNVHTFLTKVVEADDVSKESKLGNLRDDKEMNELGIPKWNVRGALKMARISSMLMDNDFFEKYFNEAAKETLATSLSREGFIIRQGTTQTKQVADITRRRKVNKGMFGKQHVEETGGDPNINRN